MSNIKHVSETEEAPTLILGATGKTGRRIVERLTAKGVSVRLGSRSAAPSFDWNNEANWDACLQGVERAYVNYAPDLAVPGAGDSITAFVEKAKQHGVRRLVLLSGRGEEEAQACEEIVRRSGLETTVVRAGWFNQNFSEGAFVDMVKAGQITLPAGDMAEPFVDVDDIADVAVAALTEPGHAGEIYEVTGPRLLTFDDNRRRANAREWSTDHLRPDPSRGVRGRLGEIGRAEGRGVAPRLSLLDGAGRPERPFDRRHRTGARSATERLCRLRDRRGGHRSLERRGVAAPASPLCGASIDVSVARGDAAVSPRARPGGIVMNWIVYACLFVGLASALVGGVFQSFSDFVMRGLVLADPPGGIESMQHINRTVFRSVFLATFLVLVPIVLGMAGYAWFNLSGAGRTLILAAALIYIVTVFLVTMLGNVPMNERLAGLAYESPEAAAYWQIYGRVWTWWNHARTFGSIATAVCFLWAAIELK